VELAEPVYLALDLVLFACVDGGYQRAQVERQLLDALSARVLPGGSAGFFHPDRFTFGQPLVLSDLVAATMAVPGVTAVEVRRFAPLGAPRSETRANLAAGQIAVAAAPGGAVRQRPEQPGGPADDHAGGWLMTSPVENPPGQPQLRRRVDTQGSALARMRADLASPRHPLQVRSMAAHGSDEPAIALLDAWAMVADVVAFYSERIATEGFLRTATQTGSVRELARTLGYELRPGVAAEADLVFTAETAPGAPATVTVAAGTPVQSVPGPGQLPQTFQTAADLEVRGVWNSCRCARVHQPDRHHRDSVGLSAGHAAPDQGRGPAADRGHPGRITGGPAAACRGGAGSGDRAGRAGRMDPRGPGRGALRARPGSPAARRAGAGRTRAGWAGSGLPRAGLPRAGFPWP
jgi:hypothetical protein